MRVVRLHRGLRSAPLLERRRQYQALGDPQLIASCACGTWDDRPSRRSARSATRRGPRHELRPRGGGRHREDDSARGPHPGPGARGPGPARPDRGRHLHRERGDHHEAPGPRAAGAGARPTEPAPDDASARPPPPWTPWSGRRSRPYTPSPRRSSRSARSSAGSSPASAWPTRREADMLFAEAWDDWLNERLVFGDEVLHERARPRDPAGAQGPWGERTSLRGLARVCSRTERDLMPPGRRGRCPEPRAWRDELLGQGGPGRRRAVVRPGASPGDLLAARLLDLVGLRRANRRDSGGPPIPRCRLKRRARDPRALPGHHSRDGPRPKLSTEARPDRGMEPRRRPAEPGASSRGADLHGRIVAKAWLGVAASCTSGARRSAGLLDFLDLLLKARDALRDRPSMRAYFRERFRFLIVDEFQDTDRVQVEIARLLAGDAPGGARGRGRRQAVDLPLPRAEVALFRRLAERDARSGRAGRCCASVRTSGRSPRSSAS